LKTFVVAEIGSNWEGYIEKPQEIQTEEEKPVNERLQELLEKSGK